MIKKSIEDLPLPTQRESHPPSANPFFGKMLGERWYKQYLDDGKDSLELAIPEAGPYRASYAGKRCDRSLYYALVDELVTNPNDMADAWRFELGHRVHEMTQQFVEEVWPGGENEVLVDLRKIGIPGSAHADTVLDHEGVKTLVETKSATGYSFKLAATTFGGPPEGPKLGALIQGAMAAKALGCERLVITNFALENLSKRWAEGDDPVNRFMAEWHYLVADLEDLIEYEVARVNAVVDMAAAEEVPARMIHDSAEAPQGAIILNPRDGSWVVSEDDTIKDTGKYWLCAYCEHKDKCIEEGE